MTTKKQVEKLLAIYRDAWQQQDSELILTIFQVDAKYHERVLEEPHIGHFEIKSYWDRKVVSSQANIVFNLLNVYVDGDTAIAEWEATFDDLKQNVPKHIKEVAILEFNGPLT